LILDEGQKNLNLPNCYIENRETSIQYHVKKATKG